MRKEGGQGICQAVASLFCLLWQGVVGKKGLGVGPETQARQGQEDGKELNTTQRSATDHGTSRTTTCTYMWKPRDTQVDTESTQPPGLSSLGKPPVPPANCHLAVPRFGSILPAPCRAPAPLVPAYLPCQ